MSKSCQAHRQAAYLYQLGVSQVAPRWTRSHTNHQVEGHKGSPKGLVHKLLMQFFTLGSSKIEVFETCFLIW